MAHRDPVTPELFEALVARDGGCIAWRLGFATECGSQFGPGRVVIEVDHVRTGGMGRRGPSTLANTVLLCGLHHRVKTDNARLWRAAIDDYMRER